MNLPATSDGLHLEAAENWLALGHYAEAHEELKQVPTTSPSTPDVLRLRWRVCVASGQPEGAFETAIALTTSEPVKAENWVMLARSYYHLGRYAEAYECARKALRRFVDDWTLHYDSACYACLLGRLWESKLLLQHAFHLDDPQTLKMMALEDKDLEPLWAEIGAL